jgi:hypothetical protein
LGEEAKKEKVLPKDVEESNSIGADAGDATSGSPETPADWAKKQPVDPEPTYPLDAGDPTPFQPGAGTPGNEGSEEDEESSGKSPAEIARKHKR